MKRIVIVIKNFITLANTMCKLPEDGAGSPKHVAAIIN
jgi:hypothetical protein